MFVLKKSCILTFFVLTLSFYIYKNALSKNLNNQNFICADKIGPRIEILIPEFDKKSKTKEFSYKIYNDKNRNLSEKFTGKITKTNSPIDYSYDYYTASLLNQKKNTKIKFEFFPPSTMMIKSGEKPFENLACWKD